MKRILAVALALGVLPIGTASAFENGRTIDHPSPLHRHGRGGVHRPMVSRHHLAGSTARPAGTTASSLST